jgi:hypothetical protein
VFLHNNIFFSRGRNWLSAYRERASKDPQETPIEPAANEAPWTRPNHDLKGVIAYNTVDIPGISTVATAIVDYRGERLVAQGVVPGIFHVSSNLCASMFFYFFFKKDNFLRLLSKFIYLFILFLTGG